MSDSDARNALASADPDAAGMPEELAAARETIARVRGLLRRSQDAADAAGEGAGLAEEVARINREHGQQQPTREDGSDG